MNKVKNSTKVAVNNVATKLADIREYFGDLVDASINDYNRSEAKYNLGVNAILSAKAEK